MTELAMPRYFTQEGQQPFGAVAWEFRDAVIMGKDGEPVFEARGVEFPALWSQRATDIVASRYFRVVNGERETSVKQMIGRVIGTIGQWGHEDRYFTECPDVFCAELTHILLHQYASFNSPVWFNVGVEACPQTSACYILDVEDSMESILEWYRQEGMIFKGGSGAGVNLSALRESGALLSSGGKASGPLSFMHVADANAGAIKSGGSTRRSACMRILDVSHPDIEAFIQCKVEAEQLAHVLRKAGYTNGIEHGVTGMIPWQNANNSVSVPDCFMRYADKPGSHVEATSAADMLRKIAQAAWECGDPSLFFKDTINVWHTTPGQGDIVSSNPCGEFLRPPNEACNLASINLLKFLKDDGSFDIPAFTHTVDVMITAMDILIDRSSYPTEAIAQNSRDYRPLGLGYANLGAMLMANGLPYDSNDGRTYAAGITALLTGQAYKRSAELACAKGAFAGWSKDQEAMASVITAHKNTYYAFVEDRRKSGMPDEIIPVMSEAHRAWHSAETQGARSGFRNCQVSVLAPCGTISFMMDCDTTGVEPCLGLVTTKKLVGGGEIHMVNGVVDRALQSLGWTNSDERHDLRVMMMETLPDALFFHKDVFATALGDNAISWQGHVKMVAAVQPFISGGISKTINMPHEATVQDVFDAYMMAWKMGLKAISIYRDGSKGVQPVTVTNPQRIEDASEEELERDFPPLHFRDVAETHEPQRRRLSDERRSFTHKFTINTHEGYITVGLYDDGSPGEIFVRMAKEGSTLGGVIDAWATVMSIALQYGVPLEVFVAKFKDGQYEPRGFTGNPEIRTSSSITDYIVRWLELRFGRTEVKLTRTLMPANNTYDAMAHAGLSAYSKHAERIMNFADNGQSNLPLCSECGNMTIRNGSCCVCTVCGTTTGCS